MKTPSPLLGFNNNVRHKGRLFHIQTEDSGVRHPHIITHLFADGGRILKTTKTSYAEHVGTPSMAETVRELMKEQHKAMFIALRDGQFDYLFDESAPRPPALSSPGMTAVRPAADPPANPSPAAVEPAAPVRPAAASSPAISSTATTAAPIASAAAAPIASAAAAPVASAAAAPIASAAAAPIKSAAPTAAAPPPAAPPLPATRVVAAAVVEPTVRRTEPPPPSKRTSSRPRLDLDPAALQALSARSGAGSAPAMQRPVVAPAAGARASRPVMPAPAPPPRAQEVQPSIDLDLDALERAAAEAQTPFFQQIQDLPPPPASVIGRRTEAASGTYSGVHAAEPPVVAPPQLGAEHLGGGAGRYAPSRPSSIFATNRPAEGASIFGEDLISEKSLDEVILSYLAEDLDNPQDKK